MISQAEKFKFVCLSLNLLSNISALYVTVCMHNCFASTVFICVYTWLLDCMDITLQSFLISKF